MSDTPQGGWWKASNGKWYPPETHPDYRPVLDRGAADVAGPPAEGWWRANDGNWYPPDAAPAPVADPPAAPADDEIDLTDQRSDELAEVPPGPLSAPTPVPVSEVLPPVADAPSSTSTSTPPSSLAVSDPSSPSQPPTAPRRGMFDLEPPDESEQQPSAPLTPRRTMFGAAASAPVPGSPGPEAPTGSLPKISTGPGAPPAQPSTGGPMPTAPTPAPSGDVPMEVPTPGGAESDGFLPGATFEPGPAASPAAASMPDDGDGTAQPGSRKWLLIGGGVALVLLIGVLAALVLGGGDDTAEQGSTTSTTETEASSTPSSTEAPSTTAAASTSVPSTTAVPAPAAPVDIPPQVTGVGSATIDVGRDSTDRLLALITHDGPGSAGVALLDADGAEVQTLVGPGVSGQYLGVLPVNFAAGSSFRSVRFTGEGPWAVTFVLPESAPRWAPETGPFASDGDRVLLVDATEPLRLVADCAECAAGLQVRPWSSSSPSTPAPLSVDDGVITVPSGTAALQVTATGSAGVQPAWSLRTE